MVMQTVNGLVREDGTRQRQWGLARSKSRQSGKFWCVKEIRTAYWWPTLQQTLADHVLCQLCPIVRSSLPQRRRVGVMHCTPHYIQDSHPGNRRCHRSLALEQQATYRWRFEVNRNVFATKSTGFHVSDWMTAGRRSRKVVEMPNWFIMFDDG